jgi:hypothetical protein
MRWLPCTQAVVERPDASNGFFHTEAIKMRKVIIALAATLALAGCTTAERTATVGAVGGAAIGAATGGTLGSAAVGAAAGAVGGYIIGRAIEGRPGWCERVDRRTGRVIETYRC